MFYDLEDPIQFASDIHKCLDENGIWHLEQSYMPSMIKNVSYDTICHEHLEYYSLKSIKYIFDKVGFVITDLDFNDINGGSLQYFICKRYIQNILIRVNDKFNKDTIRSNSITIIDTFLSPDFIHEDRWYGNFWNNIQEHLKRDIFFVPTVIDTPLSKIVKLCKNSRFNGRNIIFKDHFLRLDDFIFAYKHKHRVKRIDLEQILIDDLDLSG